MANKLTKKLGPLPVWGWGVVLGGGLLLGIYLRKRFASSSASTGGAAVPSADAGAAGTTSGSTGASVAPTDSGLSPDVESLIAQQQGLIGQLGGIIGTDQTNMATLQTQTFQFEQSIVGDLTSLLKASSPSPSPALPSTAPPSPAPATHLTLNPATHITANLTPHPTAAALSATTLQSKTAQAALKGPTAVKGTPNKTGLSANKNQGVFSIH